MVASPRDSCLLERQRWLDEYSLFTFEYTRAEWKKYSWCTPSKGFLGSILDHHLEIFAIGDTLCEQELGDGCYFFQGVFVKNSFFEFIYQPISTNWILLEFSCAFVLKCHGHRFRIPSVGNSENHFAFSCIVCVCDRQYYTLWLIEKNGTCRHATIVWWAQARGLAHVLTYTRTHKC